MGVRLVEVLGWPAWELDAWAVFLEHEAEQHEKAKAEASKQASRGGRRR